MRYVYVILDQNYNNLINLISIGSVEFAFTSLKSALNQFEAIKTGIESGKWYMGDDKHTIEDVEDFDVESTLHLIKRMKVKHHQHGSITYYTLQRVDLNNGYRI